MIEWKRIDTKTNKILLKSKINDNDIRNEKWENNEDDMRQDGFSKKYNDFNESYEFQYWIDKDICDDHENEIINFNEKCKKWDIGILRKYLGNDDYLSIEDDIDFNNFNFIKDDKYNEEWNNYLFIYKNDDIIKKGVKIDNMDIEVIIDNFNNKYIEINKNNKKIVEFMKKLENRIITCVDEETNNFNIENNYEYKYYKSDDGNYKFKVKKDYIEPKEYKNAIVYIRFNRLWKLNYIKQGNDMYSWGISLTVDKIVEKDN
jgi:hypothetical protein